MNGSIASEALTSSNTIQNIANNALFELRKLLAIAPKDRTEEWQDTSRKLVSLICADFTNQVDSSLALIEITLVALAAQKGCKEAKKRNLKPTRWLSQKPPNISDIFDDIDEAKHCIRVLQTIQSDWIESYVSLELVKNKWVELSAPLINWLIDSMPNVESLLRCLNQIHLSNPSHHKGWLTHAVENTSKIILKAQLPPGIGLMAEAQELAAHVEQTIDVSTESGTENFKQEFRRALFNLISLISSQNPSILLQGPSVALINTIFPSPVQVESFLYQELEIMCRRVLSLFEVLLPNADEALISHYRNIWNAYQTRLKIADQLLMNISKEQPFFNSLVVKLDRGASNVDLEVTAGLENIICSLVVNWDDFHLQHSLDPAVQQLNGRIEDLINQLSIVRYGDIDQIVPFDPIRHFLSETSTSFPSKVRIKKPGLALVRPDGSSRILLMAAVTQ